MSVQCEGTASQAASAPMNAFERYLSLWVFLCIIAGIVQGQLWPEVFQSIGRIEIAPVSDSPAAARRQEAVAPVQALDVLVVEDDEINRVVCQRYLESLGHRAHLTGDGCAALEMLDCGGLRVDCVLMDISLPGASGFEITQAIHGLEGGRWRELPVIGMSAHVTPETFERQMAAGMADFLGKPFQRRELARVLASAVVADAAAPPAAAEPAVAPAAVLLDLVYLTEEVDGLGRPMLLQLLDMFRQELEIASAALLDVLGRADRVQLGKLAHKLRSAAGNLGLVRVMKDCRQVELAANSGEPALAAMASLVHQLVVDCGLSVSALEQWLSEAGQGGGRGPGLA